MDEQCRFAVTPAIPPFGNNEGVYEVGDDELVVVATCSHAAT